VGWGERKLWILKSISSCLFFIGKGCSTKMFATAKAAPLALASLEDATNEYVGGRQQWAVSNFLFFVCQKN
jgi:hypothetical protein